ncbi:amino acid ABC transporter ATP-binding/permease protein [Staphylococcus intermedius]|uniref:ABC transporter ATP-binding protein n=1 Tax=Staphylococcus intermedius NCTC 11048 TaxID=1141106 RepID=A0A380GC43_STAIN|nr:amino acid ABC transporter ATP-binding/permease protein [Staphylococcus intermedius]PCF65507.1 cysteine ABC transporter ATP-binding protein [Staphylococcus intermedius]PCF81184.1 cysteine ABC transporter ATP-binding protein [Staphylococcus intermedius]PCF82467.1 cysteine ABC transporter ATP-binding protein [Staphylococcus intermedius]PCF87167.1 cysteine ABC transporter ATP-binding protein [Staphylococcus intermedius]PCF87726.1 cysteine ABC transporter ATP-binding protein [Staphylococcus int
MKLQQVINIKWDKDIVMAICIGVLGSLVALGMFFLSGYMITQSALGAPLYALMGLIVTVKLFGFIRAIAKYYERLRSHRATFTMLRDVRVQLYRALIPIVPDVFRKFRSSDLLGRMVTQVEALQNIYLRVYYPPIVIGITTLISAVTLIYFSWVHAIVLVVTIIISLFVLPALRVKKATRVRLHVDQTGQRWMHTYFDYILGYDELKRFKSEQKYHAQVVDHEVAFSQAEHLSQRSHLIYDYIRHLISMAALLSSIVLAVVMVAQQQVDIIYMTSIILMILTLLEQAVPMSQVADYKSETDLAQQSLSEVMGHQKGMIRKEKVDVQDISAGSSLFTLKDVTLYYEHQQRPSVQHLNLRIHKGEHVAIVGASGSGKSTLLQLLMGLYTPSEGQVLVGDHDLHELDMPQYYHQLNTLLQQPHFYDGTVYENLLTDISTPQCRTVLDQLHLQHIGLDRMVTFNQNTLSGGEFQRLAFARLMLRDCPIWLLDEPTTALDIENTQDIMNQMHQQAETLIVSTHDVHYLTQFDRIIQMQEGKIIGDMTPEEFLAEKVHR